MATSPSEVQARLTQVCWKNPTFKKELFANPKAAIEKYAETKFPADVKIFVHSASPKEIHLVIPDKPAGQELSDEALSKVSGGEIAVTAAIIGLTLAGLAGTVAISNDVTQRRAQW